MTITVPEGAIIEIRQSITLINAPPVIRSELGEGLWTTEQAAAYVGVHVEIGKFPRIPLPGSGKDFRFSKAMIDRWAEERALGAPKAIVAMAHHVALLVYRMLRYGQNYVEKGIEHYERKFRLQRIKWLKKEARALNLQLVAA